MTDTQTAPVSTPSTPVSAPPSEPPAKKPKRNPTPRQLEQLKNARQKRSEKAKTRKSTSIARSGGGADELLSRIEKADPDTHRQASSKSPKKRKGDIAYGGGFQLSTPKEFLIGAAALGGLGFVAYHAKKKTMNSSSAQQQETATPQFQANNVFV